MLSFLLIVVVLQFSQTDAACNEGDQLLKAMRVDGSPACRHCHCWGNMMWFCMEEKSACNWPYVQYSNDDQQLALVEYQQSDTKQNQSHTQFKLSNSNDRCPIGDRIIHVMLLNGLPACRQCTCFGTAYWGCTVETKACNMPSIEEEICAKSKLSGRKILLYEYEKCLICSCRNGLFLCTAIKKGDGNILDEETCGY